MKGIRFNTAIQTKQIVKKNGVYYVIDLTNPKLKQNGRNNNL
jgi:hypothetical protein